MSAFISWRRLDMSEDEKLYLVCDDSPGEPRTKEEIENDRRLDNDPVVQAKIKRDMEEAKRIFGLEFNNKNNNHQIWVSDIFMPNCPQRIYNKDEKITRGWFNAIIRWVSYLPQKELWILMILDHIDPYSDKLQSL